MHYMYARARALTHTHTHTHTRANTHTHTHTHTCHEFLLAFKARENVTVQKRCGYTAVYVAEWKSYFYYLCKCGTRRKVLIVAPSKTNIRINSRKIVLIFNYFTSVML